MCLTVDIKRTRQHKRKKEIVAYKVVKFSEVEQTLKAPSRLTPYSVSRPIKAKNKSFEKLHDGQSLYGSCVHAFLSKPDAALKWEVHSNADRLIVEIKTTGKNVVAVGRDFDGDIGFKQLTLTKDAVKKAIIEKLALQNQPLFNFYLSLDKKAKNG